MNHYRPDGSRHQYIGNYQSVDNTHSNYRARTFQHNEMPPNSYGTAFQYQVAYPFDSYSIRPNYQDNYRFLPPYYPEQFGAYYQDRFNAPPYDFISSNQPFVYYSPDSKPRYSSNEFDDTLLVHENATSTHNASSFTEAKMQNSQTKLKGDIPERQKNPQKFKFEYNSMRTYRGKGHPNWFHRPPFTTRSFQQPAARYSEQNGKKHVRFPYPRHNYHHTRHVSRNYSRNRDSKSLHNKFDDLYIANKPEKEKETFSRLSSQSAALFDNNATGFSAASRHDNASNLSHQNFDQREILVQSLHAGTYECIVCYAVIGTSASVWSCKQCFQIFHLFCIQKWVKSSIKDGDSKQTGWRCPTCQKVSHDIPSTYLCFCGKQDNPAWNHRDTAHSCGEVCGKAYGGYCPHKCNMLCHPGPCPPCELSCDRKCQCGRTSKTMRCRNSEDLRCDIVCDKFLDCGQHKCQRVCHEGPCPSCAVITVQQCYGDHESREVRCGTPESRVSRYQCAVRCSLTLDCRNHQCERPCHEGDCFSCLRQPSVLKTCACGKTELADLIVEERISCLDPLPCCELRCDKLLSCGPSTNFHRCQSVCHDGKCPECSLTTEIVCKCGAIRKEVPCREALNFHEDNPFRCTRRCNKKRSCRRHRCNQPCCVDTEHNCPLTCGQRLNCGKHRCDFPCHSGNCTPCLQTGFEELTCYCGAEVIYPPVPCGTKPPPCTKLCTRAHPCDHDVQHNCHSDRECPPCVVLTSKMCMGGHELRNNIPCHQSDVSCGMLCGKELPCKHHRCIRVCHKGNCITDQSENCKQPCPVIRPGCSHPCSLKCHGADACPPSFCNYQVEVKCECGNRKALTKCSARSRSTSDSKERSHQIFKFNQLLQDSQNGQGVDIRELTQSSCNSLDCDESCAILERDKRLAKAFGLPDCDTTTGARMPPTSLEYSVFLRDFARNNQLFVASIERELSDLVTKAQNSKQSARSYSFPPMNMSQRRFIHELAPAYGCDTRSYDSEPKKNVMVTAYSKKSWIPFITLTTSIQREEQAQPPLPIPHVHSESELRQAGRCARQSTTVLVQTKGDNKY